MVSHPALARWSAVIIGLLACNTSYYIVAGRISEALESVAWYALLILFVIEASNARLPMWALTAVRGVRALATLAITLTAVLYVREKEWLDAVNLLLWITVVVLLEVEIRQPSAVARHHKAFTIAVASLYAALCVLVLVWLAMGKWMNACDASLWLAAFGILELDLLSAEDTQEAIKNTI